MKLFSTYIKSNSILFTLGLIYYNIYCYHNKLIIFYSFFKNLTLIFIIDYYKKLIDYDILNKKELCKDIFIGAIIEFFIIKN